MRYLIPFLLLGVQTGQDTEIMPAGGHSWRGDTYITTGGVVDVNAVGQGVRVKADSAGIVWGGSDLIGMALTDESLVVTYPGDYLVIWTAAITGTQGKNYLFEVMTDTDNDPSAGATPHDECHNDTDIKVNTHTTLPGACLVTVAAGEYVYLTVQEPGAGGATNFTIDHAGLVLVQQ